MSDPQWLTQQIRVLAEGQDFDAAFGEGLVVLRRFRDDGGTQHAARAALTALHDDYRDRDEAKMDFVDDLLDCVVGWTGNQENHIWSQPRS